MNGLTLLNFIDRNVTEIDEDFQFSDLGDVEKDTVIRFLVNDDNEFAFEVVPGAAENPSLIKDFRYNQSLYMDKLRKLVNLDSANLNSEAIDLYPVDRDQFKELLYRDQWEFYRLLVKAIVYYIEEMVEGEIDQSIGEFMVKNDISRAS